jgi:hypothetical protein
MESKMDAKSVARIINDCADALAQGDDPVAVISDAISFGYAAGLRQGHWDRDPENAG